MKNALLSISKLVLYMYLFLFYTIIFYVLSAMQIFKFMKKSEDYLTFFWMSIFAGVILSLIVIYVIRILKKKNRIGFWIIIGLTLIAIIYTYTLIDDLGGPVRIYNQ